MRGRPTEPPRPSPGGDRAANHGGGPLGSNDARTTNRNRTRRSGEFSDAPEPDGQRPLPGHLHALQRRQRGRPRRHGALPPPRPTPLHKARPDATVWSGDARGNGALHMKFESTSKSHVPLGGYVADDVTVETRSEPVCRNVDSAEWVTHRRGQGRPRRRPAQGLLRSARGREGQTHTGGHDARGARRPVSLGTRQGRDVCDVREENPRGRDILIPGLSAPQAARGRPASAMDGR